MTYTAEQIDAAWKWFRTADAELRENACRDGWVCVTLEEEAWGDTREEAIVEAWMCETAKEGQE